MLNIPPIYFYIIWPILYTFLLVSCILYTLYPPANKKQFFYGIFFFSLNIFLNILYLVLYFGLDSYYGGVIDLIFMIVTAWITFFIFVFSQSKYRILCSLLYLFYCIWISFALFVMVL
jgi:tryptophan-rich sensory protein